MRTSRHVKRVIDQGNPVELKKLLRDPELLASAIEDILRLAAALREEGDIEQSLALVRQALRSRKDLSRAGFVLLSHFQADCLLDKRRFAAAVLVYDSILSSVNDATAYANRGLARWQLGNYRTALEDYLRAAALDPKDSIVQRSIGELQNKLGCSTGAAKHLERALRLDPSSARSLSALGVAYHNLNKWVKAYRALKRALEIDPHNRIALLGIRKMDQHLEQ